MTRVNAGIRSAATDTSHRVTADLNKRLLQRLLDRAVLFLGLPAMIGTAIIGEVQNNISFQSIHAFQSP